MLDILWEIALPLLIAFVVGWGVMGWLTWRWRRAGVSQGQWQQVNEELKLARSQLNQAKSQVTDLEAASVVLADAVASATVSSGAGGAGGGQTTAAAVAAEPPAEPAVIDDLKAIRGIGAKMESKLNGLGITSLRQIAAFDADEIERVSAGLGAFPGRIERDRWVPQAKDLVASLPPDDLA